MTPSVGTIVNGKYRIETLVGSGGQGDVYRSVDMTLGRTVALKLLWVDRGVNPDDVRKRCEREALALAKLDHPFIVRVHEVGQVASTGEPFLAMQYFDGQPLLAWGSLAARSHIMWLRIADKICDALSHAHARGILHRDIKSSNVLVGSHPTQPDICLIDWGIARDNDATRLTRSGALTGTIGSVDPAVILGDATWSPQSDLYSLGALLYRAILGRTHLHVPEGSPDQAVWAIAAQNRVLDPHAVDPSLPRSIAELLVSLLAGAPHHRPSSASDVRHTIRELSGITTAPHRKAPATLTSASPSGGGRFEMSFRIVSHGGLHVFLWIHTAENPPNDEFETAMEHIRLFLKATPPSAPTAEPLSHIRELIVSDGGGPNLLQRGIHASALNRNELKASVVSTVLANPVKRGIVRAVSWHNPSFRAFTPDQWHQALAHLDLTNDLLLINAFGEMALELRTPNQSLEIISQVAAKATSANIL